MRIDGSTKNLPITAQPTAIQDATVSAKDGVLTIQAGDKGAKIDVQEDYKGLDVTVNGKKYHFDPGEYPKGIEVKGGAGNDDINVGWGIEVPVMIDGGAGDDSIKNSNHGSTIRGGGGKDYVLNHGEKANITVGDESKVDNILGHGSKISAGEKAKISNDSDDSFVRVGKGGDIFNLGSRNTIELTGKSFIKQVGDDNVIRSTADDGYSVHHHGGKGNVFHGTKGRENFQIYTPGNTVHGNGGPDRFDVLNGNTVYRGPIKG